MAAAAAAPLMMNDGEMAEIIRVDYNCVYDDVEVSVDEVCHVKPEVPTEAAHHHLYLSSLDLFWRDFLYNRRLLFYKIHGLHEQSLMVEKLKSSLSQVLVPFYPLAGRLASNHGSTRPAIDCGDQGVELVHASVDASLQELEEANFQPCAFFNKLAQWAQIDFSKLNDLPLLSIQVTKFRCGGIAIGYAHSHVVGDGRSMWHFMNSWAEVARGKAMTLAPTHDRSFFRVDEPSQEIASHMNLPPRREDSEGLTGPLKPEEPLVERLFHVSAHMIASLKSLAHTHPPPIMPPRGFSSCEVLCAHWWRRVMKARNLVDHDLVRFAVLADMRTRVTPPLPPSYFGNAIMFAFANSTYGELKGDEFGNIALKIHQASQDCDEPRLWAKVHWLELHGNVFGNRVQFLGSIMNVASSPKFNVYGVDFGWGKPIAVRTVHVNGDGEMVLFRNPHGGIDVCMPLTRPTMERLLQDPEFLPM